MIKIGILGEIGSGKSFVAKKFGYPVYSADREVTGIYKNNKSCFLKLRRKLPKFIKKFPIDKRELGEAILHNKNNLKKITRTVHPIVRKSMLKFLSSKKNKKAVILDIPLLLENKLVTKDTILVYVDAKKNLIKKRLIKRKFFNKKIFNNFDKMQIAKKVKKKKSDFIIINNLKTSIIEKQIQLIKKEIFKK